MKCPRCGHGLPLNARFCWKCGGYLDDMVEGSDPFPETTRTADIPDNRLEDQIQEAGRKALALLGFTVYSLSQDRKTRQTPGIADTYVAGWGRTTWAEWKTVNGIQSDDQIAFEKRVTENGAEYQVWRHENEAIAWARVAMAASR